MSRLRVGCVGTGFIAGRHLEALSGFPDVELVAVADALQPVAEATAARYGARPYGDGLALLESEHLDAVWLCVPPFAHGPLERAALDRDLPFFVEKPIACDLATALDIARLVRERRLLTAVGYHWRHLGVVDRAAAFLRDSPAQLITGHWHDSTPAADWWSRRERSGGQVVEQTTHIFDLARLFAGEVDTVHAVEVSTARDRFPDADTPTAAGAMLHFRSGAVGMVTSTCILDWRHRVGLQLMAEGRVVELAEQTLCDHELRIVTADGEDVTHSDEDPIEREDRAFLDAVRGDTGAAVVSYADALRTHALACAADRSAREGVPVKPAEEAVDA